MFNIFKYQFYIYQLEEYQTRRYLRSYLHLFKPKPNPRKKLDFTSKIKILIFLDLFLVLVLFYLLWFFFKTKLGPDLTATALALVTTFALTFLLHPLILCLAQAILFPLEKVVKNLLVKKARRKVKCIPSLNILNIAGSYGKTTTKELTTLLAKQKYSVLATPENINTPLGIAKLLLQEPLQKYEWLIAELGEYKPGDIDSLCNLITPRVGIITGINEAHIERMGGIQNAEKTMFELAEHTNETLLLNADDNRICTSYTKHQLPSKVYFYGYKRPELSGFRLLASTLSDQDLRQTFTIEELDNKKQYAFTTFLLSDYAFGLATLTLRLGRLLNIPEELCIQAFQDLKPVPHRLEPSKNPNGTIIIDDSYNGNPEGVKQALQTLAKFKNKRKVVLTPGLVETGAQNQLLHEEIGRELAKTADLVMLINNSAYPHILTGLQKQGFAKDHIIVFKDTTEAHQELGSYIKSGDVILFQNDWSDNYY